MSDDRAAPAWYLARDGQQHGPIPDGEFRALVDRNMVLATDLVWREGLSQWVAAEKVLHLLLNGAAAGPPSIPSPAVETRAPEGVETAQPKEKAEIFISYSQKDRAVANWLAGALATRGYGVWWDTKLVGGQEFRDAIMRQLAVAKTVLVLWSANSIQSRFVLDEADRAAAGGKLVSVLLDGFDARDLPVGFGTFQSVKISDETKLVEALINRGLKGTEADPSPIAAASAGSQSRTAIAEEAAWQFASKSNNDKLMREFLRQYPESPFAGSIRAQIQQENAAWDFARNSGNTELLEEFQRQYPNSEHVLDAKWLVVKASGNGEAITRFYAEHPTSAAAIEDRARQEAEKTRQIEEARRDKIQAISSECDLEAAAKVESRRQNASLLLSWLFIIVLVVSSLASSANPDPITGFVVPVLASVIIGPLTSYLLKFSGLLGSQSRIVARLRQAKLKAAGLDDTAAHRRLRTAV